MGRGEGGRDGEGGDNFSLCMQYSCQVPSLLRHPLVVLYWQLFVLEEFHVSSAFVYVFYTYVRAVC